MVSADQFHASEVRIRQAKDHNRPYGGLGMTLSGDFLQLPPVDPGDTQKSLATPLSETGALDMAPENPDAKDRERKRSKLTDSVNGIQLWHRVRHVVCLDVNIRAPGALSTLLAEMRDGKGISKKSWDMYQKRIMQRDDQRLSDETSPFSKYEWQFIVHRHKIRVHRSLVNARAATSDGQKPLYIVQARDEAVHSKDDRKMPRVREELLRRASPRDTQSLPGILPLYVGMRLTFQEKDEGAHGACNPTFLIGFWRARETSEGPGDVQSNLPYRNLSSSSCVGVRILVLPQSSSSSVDAQIFESSEMAVSSETSSENLGA